MFSFPQGLTKLVWIIQDFGHGYGAVSVCQNDPAGTLVRSDAPTYILGIPCTRNNPVRIRKGPSYTMCQMYDTTIRGWTQEVELKYLEKWSRGVPDDGTIVEVGSLHGRTAYALAASAPSATLYCFDKWNGTRYLAQNIPILRRAKQSAPLATDDNTVERFMGNMKGLTNVVPKVVACAAEIGWSGQPVDLMFLDAEHRNPSDWEYIEYWLPFIKSGGYLAGHDYIDKWPDVMENVHRLQTMLGPVELGVGSLWRFRKP